MQNNRRDDLKAQTSNLQSRRPANSSQNIQRVSAPGIVPTRVYPEPKPNVNTRPNFYAQSFQSRASLPNSEKSVGNTRTSRIYPEKLPPKAKAPLPKKRKPSKLLDFLLGLAIGFAVFGTAAVFVVRSVIEIFE